MSDDEREEKELDLSSSEVVTKYKGAAEIVNKALQLVVKECKPKAKIVDICEKGDAFIREQTGNMYKNSKKKIERGVAFPTCLSVNNTVCHFSPLASDTSELEEGDMVKIDMGCHIDGFIAVVAHTHVVQSGPITGKQADVVAAANTAAEVALRLVRPGKKNKDVSDAIQKVAAAYDCKIVEGVLSHQLKQFVIDGNKVILSVSNPDTRVDDAEFEENEVYAVDIVASTGEGKPKLLDEKQTTIYKRAVDKNYHLKMKASRFIFSEINQRFPILPFTTRALEEKRARLGLVECVNHDLLQPYPVLYEKPGDYVAHIKFTVLLMPNGSDRITSHPLQELQSTKTIDDPEIKAWLALGSFPPSLSDQSFKMAFVKAQKTKAYFKRFQVPYKRRREGKTDYRARIRLINQDKNKYNTPKYRFVVRFSNKDVTAQIVSANIAGDMVLASAYSHELPRYGLEVGLTNYAAAYCTGLLLGRRVLKMLEMDDEYQGNVEATGEDFSVEPTETRRPFRALLDVGLIRTTTGNRVFGALKGALDAGLDIPHSDKRFAGFSKDNKQLDAEVHSKYIYGGHVAAYMRTLMEDEPEKYQSHFSEYIKRGIEADNIESLYKKVHAAIRADPTAKKTEKEPPKQHKRFNLKKLTYEERKSKLIERLHTLNAAAGADSEEED